MPNSTCYIILDVETTMHSPPPRESNPFDPRNSMVAFGLRGGGDRLTGDVLWHIRDEAFAGHIYPSFSKRARNSLGIWLAVEQMAHYLVGHNIKFDLEYLSQDHTTEFFDALRQRCVPLWDTQIVEYLLTGQRHKLASLDELSEKYGGVPKNTAVTDLWAAGVQTEGIDRELLLDYLKDDLCNTEKVFLAQYKKAEEMGMLNLITVQMQALWAVIEMEINGMHVDRKKVNKALDDIVVEEEILSHRIGDVLHRVYEASGSHVNVNSTDHLSALLFGGTIQYTKKVPSGIYKSGARKGQVRYSNHVATEKYPRRFDPPASTATGKHSVTEDVLKELAAKGTPHSELPLMLLKKRKLQKLRTTYHKNFLALADNYGIIHQTLHQCSTVTGRLSCVRPNLQNVPSEGVKHVFTSRYGKHGSLVEVDWKQLEVVALAFLSADPQLREDIINKVHTHTMRAKELFDTASPTREQVKKAKTMSFELQYGAGARAIAKRHGISLSAARGFVSRYYDRYAKIKPYHRDLYEQLEAAAGPPDLRTKLGFPCRQSELVSATGRRYYFRQYDAPQWRGRGAVDWSHTELANHPVQGFATGDFMPMMMGVIHKSLLRAGLKSCLMINTVHDSALFDVHNVERDAFKDMLEQVCSSSTDYVQKLLKIDFDLPLEVTISHGPSWQDCS